MIDLGLVTLLKYAMLAGATQILLTVLWNIFIHPLSNFPGPKWAAATDWYKTYQEAICQKSWFTVLEELHAQYGMIRWTDWSGLDNAVAYQQIGPIVRVGPSEVCTCAFLPSIWLWQRLIALVAALQEPKSLR